MSGVKTYLLFQPRNLFTKRPLLEIRMLIKTPEGITTGAVPLTRPQLKKYFPRCKEDTVKAVLAFAPAELLAMNDRLLQECRQSLAGVALMQAHKKAWTRHLHAITGMLRRQTDTPLFHASGDTEKRIQTVQCHFYAYPVELCFKVQGGQIETFIELGKEKQPLHDFQRVHFLLEKDHCYYQLTYKSYETAEWLRMQDSNLSVEEVLQYLKDKDFKVEDLSETLGEQLVAIPQSRVYISELNHTFLKIEPQFIYDGHLVDGPYEPAATVQSGAGTIHVIRNKDHEEQLVNLLRSFHEKFSGQRNGFFYLTFAEAQKKAWFLKVYHQLLEMDIELVGLDMMHHFRLSPHVAITTVTQLPQEGDFLPVMFSVKFGKETVAIPHLQKALLAGQKTVMLRDGSLGVLGEEWLRQYGQVIRHSRIRNKELLVPRWVLLSETVLEEGSAEKINNSNIGKGWLDRWKAWEQLDATQFKLPEGLQVQALRPYQQKGFEWMQLLAEIGGSGILADDMGLGKTLQTICFLLSRIEAQPGAQVLIVAPASLLYNWQQEFEKFAPAVKTLIFHGASRSESALTGNGYPVIITSYGTLRQDLGVLQTIGWDTIVADESHYIKNPAAQTTRAAWELAAKTKIALSGTPVMNSVSDLYSQMHFLLPGLLGNHEFFKKEYAVPIEQKADTEKAAALQKLVRPFVLRRTKEQVAPDLPPKTESVLWCEMEADQRAAYESIKENVRGNILLDIQEQGLQKGKLSVLAGLMKLRQLCNSAELVKDEDLFTYGNVKTKVLINELKTIVPRHRALVFSQFTSMLDLLERDLSRAGIPTIRLDGQTRISQRQELVNQFQSDEGDAAVFLLSLKAGNAGLNLTKADYVFLFDPWWNTAVEHQAIDRAHRIGRASHVFAYRMICKDSIEEKILKMAAGKKKLAEDLVTADESFMRNMTLDDIKYLLE